MQYDKQQAFLHKISAYFRHHVVKNATATTAALPGGFPHDGEKGIISAGYAKNEF